MEKPNNVPAEAQWYSALDCWELGKKDKDQKKIGIWEYWRESGSKYLELEFNDGNIISLTKFNEEDVKVLIERYQTSTPEFNVFTVASISIVQEDKKWEIEYQDDKCSLIKVYENEKLYKTYDFSSIHINNLQDFTSYFDEIYTSILDKRKIGEIVVAADFYGIECKDIYSYKHNKYFKASQLFDCSGGDQILIIEEQGELFGKVYFNAHDDGLYSVEDINDYLKMFHPDMLNKTDLTQGEKDKLIKSLPLRLVAENLDELFKSIIIRSHENFNEDLIELIQS